MNRLTSASNRLIPVPWRCTTTTDDPCARQCHGTLVALCTVLAVILTNLSGTASALFIPDGTPLRATVNVFSFPIPGSVYVSTQGTTFPEGPILLGDKKDDRLEVYFDPAYSIGLPAPGDIIQSEIFGLFSGHYINSSGLSEKWSQDGVGTWSISGSPLPSDLIALGGATITTGTWGLELQNLALPLELVGPDGPVNAVLRESPTLSSLGEHSVSQLSDGSVLIDSFVNVYFEVSLNGGPYLAANGPVRLELTRILPEPTTLAQLGLAVVWLGPFIRRIRGRAGE